MLKFGKNNAKLKNLAKKIGYDVYTFSIPSGHSCPFAFICLSKAIRKDGKTHIQDGPHTQFRCFSASSEVIYPALYDMVWHNWNELKACRSLHGMTELILESIPPKARCIRIHIDGDFYTPTYFKAWCDVATLRSDILFYAYTKSLPFWVDNRDIVPDNMILTASRGGSRDDLIDSENLREAVVVYSEDAAKSLGLEIDHDDSHAALPSLKKQSFALLIHGIQPAGSEAGKAVRELKGVGSYGKVKTV